MINRYEDCDESLVEVFLDILEKRFPNLAYLKFKLMFDTKKRISKGNTVLASVALTSDMIKFFSKDDVAVDGYDYVLIVDKKAWDLAGEKDRKRIVSHELRHVFVDEKGNCKVVGHEIEDFYEELRLNQDDPEWSRNLAQLVRDVYEQEKEANKTS